MYISDLENKKRLFFSLLASCGLILFLASLSVYMINGAEGLDSVVISACFLLTALSAIVILIGAGVSARERYSRCLRLQFSFGRVFPLFCTA